MFSEYFVYLLLLFTQYINLSFKLVEIFEPSMLWVYYLHVINVINSINCINVINSLLSSEPGKSKSIKLSKGLLRNTFAMLQDVCWFSQVSFPTVIRSYSIKLW